MMRRFKARRIRGLRAMLVASLPLWAMIPLGKQVLLLAYRRRGKRDARVWSHLGLRHLDRLSDGFARFMAELAIAAAPTWPDGYRLLGLVYERAGDHQQARAAFERGLAKNPDDVPLRGALGDALRALD